MHPRVVLGVAVGVPPAVEGVRLAARIGPLIIQAYGNGVAPLPPGGTPRLYGRRDAHRYTGRELVDAPPFCSLAISFLDS